MKKLLVMMLIGSMVFGVTGCSGKVDNSSDSKNESVEATKEDDATEEKTEKETEEKTITEEETTIQEETTTVEETTTDGNKPFEYEIVPADCVYLTSDGERLTSGDVMPMEPSHGDTFTTLHYVYEYGCIEEEPKEYPEYIEGWNVTVQSAGYSEYEDILSSINKAPVVCMLYTFEYCRYMEKAPEIPDTVKVMYKTFSNCHSLKEAPAIPDGVIDISGAFYGCKTLVNAPVIPDGVNRMDYSFVNCESLKIAPEIPDSVTDMNYTFYDCASLTTAPQISSNVVNMNYTFAGCFSLTNEIIFNSNPASYEGCFSEVDFIAQNFTISGKTSLIKELRETRKVKRPSTFI